MKSVFNFKQLLIAMATVVMALNLSSCKDQNFDWDNAHANDAQEKFNDAFIKAFGKPAEGHQWGFDLANIAMCGEVKVKSGTRATRVNIPDGVEIAPDSYYKQDENIGNTNVRVTTMFGRPNSITQKEHDEVFAWFSNHKVHWVNTPVNYDYQDNDGKYASKFTQELVGGTWVDKSDGVIRAYTIDPTNPNYGSLKDNEHKNINPLGPIYIDDNEMWFRNGWIQNVAGDTEVNDPCTEEHLHTGNNCSKMNYIAFRSLASTVNKEYWVHANDYNNPSTNEASTDGLTKGNGNWGWGKQPSQASIDNGTAGDVSNAGLLLNADFNTMTFSCSLDNTGNKLHNKYYVVYLEGDGYSGYYLGLDLESLSDSDCDKNIPADGICNDWIIKIGDAGGTGLFTNVRIMCEDLGGLTDPTHKISVGDRVLVTDIDYNDIVFDVEMINNASVVKITLQAAGGTMPLTIWYDNTPLFETHEFFKLNLLKSEHASSITKLSDEDYMVMYNTHKTIEKGKTETASSRSVYLYFKNSTIDNNNKYVDLRNDIFSLDKIKVKVWRLGLDDYRKNNGDYSEAAWVTLDNIEGMAPLKFCVPLTVITYPDPSNPYYQVTLPVDVKWMIEYEAIDNGYIDFKEYVANPLEEFWHSPARINESYLY